MATSIEIVPATVPITVTQGNTLTWTTTILVDDVPVDLTAVGTVVTVTIEATTTGTNILVVSSEDVGTPIVLGADGTAAVTITNTQTAAITVGGYYYALKWTSDAGVVRTLHAGSFTVTKPIT